MLIALDLLVGCLPKNMKCSQMVIYPGRIRKKSHNKKSKNKKGPQKKIKATSHEILVGFKMAS